MKGISHVRIPNIVCMRRTLLAFAALPTSPIIRIIFTAHLYVETQVCDIQFLRILHEMLNFTNRNHSKLLYIFVIMRRWEFQLREGSRMENSWSAYHQRLKQQHNRYTNTYSTSIHIEKDY